ncbi:MAG: hypothetical protein Q6L60_07975 [Thermostichus sp. HHBFW_bins_43]
MAIIAFLYAAAIVLLLTGLLVWATSNARRMSLDTELRASVPPEECPEAAPASLLEQLERQYRNSPSYNADP